MLTTRKEKSHYISRVSDQNDIPLLYVVLEKHHSGREPSICSKFTTTSLSKTPKFSFQAARFKQTFTDCITDLGNGMKINKDKTEVVLMGATSECPQHFDEDVTVSCYVRVFISWCFFFFFVCVFLFFFWGGGGCLFVCLFVLFCFGFGFFLWGVVCFVLLLLLLLLLLLCFDLFCFVLFFCFFVFPFWLSGTLEPLAKKVFHLDSTLSIDAHIKCLCQTVTELRRINKIRPFVYADKTYILVGHFCCQELAPAVLYCQNYRRTQSKSCRDYNIEQPDFSWCLHIP